MGIKRITDLDNKSTSTVSADRLFIYDSTDQTLKNISPSLLGGGSGGVNAGVALIDSTYASNDAVAHTYKDFDVAVSTEPENTIFIFQQDAQSFDVTSALYLKLDQKFYCGFQPSSGINISCQDELVSTASLGGYTDRSTSNIFGAGIIIGLDGGTNVSLKLRDSFVTFKYLLYCATQYIDAMGSEITIEIDPTSPNVNLGMPYFQLTDSSFTFEPNNDNSSYFSAMAISNTGDSPNYDIYISPHSGATQYIRAIQYSNYSSFGGSVEISADEIYINNYANVYGGYFYAAYIHILNSVGGKIYDIECDLTEYLNPSPTRKTRFVSINNSGKIRDLEIDIDSGLTLPNSTHNFNEIVYLSCSGDSETHILPAITANGNFSNTNFTNFAGMKVSDMVLSGSSRVEFEGTRFNKDIFYTTPEYFTVTSNTQYNANQKSPSLIIRGDLVSSTIIDFGNTVVGTISDKTLIEVENSGSVLQNICLDVFTDEVTVTRSSGSDASTRNFLLLNCDDANYLTDSKINAKQLISGISDVNFYVSHSSDCEIKLNYYDDFNSDCVLYLNGKRNTYKLTGEVNGVVRQGGFSGASERIKIEELDQGLSYTADLYCDIDNVVVENCNINDLIIDAAVSNCMGYGNIVNGTYTDNGTNSRFFNASNVGCADFENGSYSETITNPGSWSDGGTYYYVDINHNLGVNDFNVELWEDNGVDYEKVLAEVYQVSKSVLTCQIRVSKTPDNRFAGKVNIISQGSVVMAGGGLVGDMLASVYDPTGVVGDVFDMDNMNDGTTNKVLTTNSQIIAGIKSFTSFPITPSSLPSSNYQVANKAYVDGVIGGVVSITCYNNSGVTITKGKVVTPTGSFGGNPIIELADATDYDKSRFVGVAIADIPDATTGTVYVFGTVSGLDTSTLSVGPVYLDTNGDLTDVRPTGSEFYVAVGFVQTISATTGIMVVDPKIMPHTTEIIDTNGFPADQRAATTLSFDNASRTFTIAPTGSSFHYYEKSIKYIKTTAQTFTIGAFEEGPHAIYFDGDTLMDFYNPTPDQYNNIIRNHCLVTGVYWDATNAEAIYLADHRYGINMSPATHVYLSSTVGIQYISGIAMNTINATGDGSLDSHAQFGVDLGQLINKDLFYDTAAIGSTVGLNIFHFDGALGFLRSDTNAGFSVLTTGTGRLAYNQYTGGAYQLTECTDGYFTLCHIIANADVNNPITAYLGLNEFATITEARNAAKTEIYEIELLLTRTEVVPIATIIFQTDDTYTNSVKAKIVEFETGIDYKNHVSEIDTITIDNHNDLSNVELANTGVTFGHVNDGIQTIYGVKTFDEFSVTPSSGPTTDYQVANKKYVDDNDGKVQQITVYNGTGSSITKGKVVTPSGYNAGSGCVSVSLADATDYDKSRFVGMANETIANGSTGTVYLFGAVSEIDTSTLAVGPAYLTTDGNLSSTIPVGENFDVVVGYVTIANAITGQIIIDPSIGEITNEVVDTNGFPGTERDATTLSFNDGTRVFTIAPTGSDFHYYICGVKYIKTTSQTVTIDNVEGIHVIYFDGETLTALATPTQTQEDTIIRTKCIVSYIYWDATNSEQNYIADERHGISMSPQTHSYLHFSRGAQYLYGLALNTISADQDGSLDAHAQFGIDLGGMVDEDLVTTSDAIVSTVGLPIYYLDGASGNLRETSNAGFAVIDDVTAGIGATGRLVYNQYTGGAYQLTTVTDTYCTLLHVYIVNSDNDNKKIIAIMGQNEYADCRSASLAITTELAALDIALPLYEIVPIGTIIFNTDSTYTNSVKAVIISTLDGDDYKDWRTTIYANNISPVSHSELTNVVPAGLDVEYGHINDDGQTLYGVKTFNSFPVTPSSAPTTDYQVANKKYVDDSITALAVPLGMALSDEVTDLTTGTAKTTFRMPFAMTITEVRASVSTAPTGANIVVDINEEGVSILSTKLSIDVSEKTSTTATSAAVISDANLADDAEITIDIDQVGSTVAGTGLKIWLIGRRA